MPEKLGLRLRQQRERQEIALATIAERTKIKLSLLQELERDDISHWPTGIFRRAFVRSYAAAIGMDQEAAVREFLAEHPDPVEEVDHVPSEPGGVNGSAGSSAGPPTRFRFFVGSLLARVRGELIDTQGPPSIVAPSPAGPASAVREIHEATAPDPQPLPVLATEPPPEAAVPTPEVEPQPAPLMPPEPDLDAIAQLCTDFGRFDDLGHVRPLVETAAGLLGAVGLIVWVWDARVNELIPVLTHGYSDYVLSLVPKVRRESDNATAAAFRTAQTCVVSGSEHASGALVVPMMVPDGCIGVLAIELRDQAEHRPSVRSLATIVASQLTRLIDASRLLALADRRLA